MKNLYLLLLFCLTTCLIVNTSAQSIDSISIEILKIRNSSTGPWQFSSEHIDSFSVDKRISSVYKNWNNNWTNNLFYNNIYSGTVLVNTILQKWDSLQWI